MKSRQSRSVTCFISACRPHNAIYKRDTH